MLNVYVYICVKKDIMYGTLQAKMFFKRTAHENALVAYKPETILYEPAAHLRAVYLSSTHLLLVFHLLAYNVM